MDRDRWETFLEKHLTPADQAFPSVPPVPGDWKTLSPEDSLPLLLDLTQAQLAGLKVNKIANQIPLKLRLNLNLIKK